jgi:uncharacterized coiled-coil protein SlyX
MEPCLGQSLRPVNLEIFSFAGLCNIPGKMIDYKQKYIESSAEVKTLTKQLAEAQKTMDKQTKKLEKATKTRKPREETFRNQRIGEIIRELKQNQPELTTSADDGSQSPIRH